MLYTKELAEQLLKAVDGVEIKASEDDKDYIFDVIATTQDVDRDNEVILVDGWDSKNWEKNPVILANHSYTIESIIGKGIKFYTQDGKKRLKGVFSKSNPLGELAMKLYKEGMLNTVSVGFIPRQRNEQNYKIIEKAELLEVSFVAVPANPNATRIDGKLFDEAVSKGLIIKSEDEPTEPTPWELDVPLFDKDSMEEPTVTPCEGCGCEDCGDEQKCMIRKVLKQQDILQEQVKSLGLTVKSLADNNVTGELEEEELTNGKKLLQEVDNYLNESLRQLKKVIAQKS